MAKFRGSAKVTLVDVSDAKQLTASIVSDKPKQVIYNPNTNVYLPNFSTTPATLTPELYISGNVENIANQVKATRWYYQENSSGTKIEITGNTDTYELSTTQPRTLKIKRNVFESLSAMTYTVQMDYLDGDTATGIVVTAQAMLDMTKVSNGRNGEITILSKLDAPDGTFIKNDQGVVTLNAKMYKGNDQIAPEQIRWYRAKDGSIDPDAGSGWELIGESGVRNLFELSYVSANKIDKGFSLTGWGSKVVGNENIHLFLKPNTTYRISYKFKLNTLTPESNAHPQGTHGSLWLYSASTEYESILLSNMSFTENVEDANTWQVGTVRERVCTFTTPENFNDVEANYALLAYTRRSMVEDVATVESGEFYDVILEEDTGKYHKWVPAQDDNNILVANQNRLLKSDKEVTAAREFVNSSNWDLAPLIDSYGLDQFYSISFDLKSNVEGEIKVYSQNGSTARYDIGSYMVNATTEFQRFAIQFQPNLNNINTAQSYLAFFGEYDTGKIPTIKNVKFELGKAKGVPEWIPHISEMNPQKIIIQDDSIIVPANEVDGTLPIRALISYEGVTSAATETIADISDPIQPVIIGNQYFKNGQGENSYTYRLYRGGVEYDPEGTLGTYTWTLWDKSGQQVSSFRKTGKTITVTSDEFSERAEIDCEFVGN